MSYGRLLFLTFVLFIEAGQLAWGQISCLNNGNYTRNSTYAVNLNSTFPILSREVSDSGFYTVFVGQGSDRANSVVLCRGDVQLEECRKCIGEGADELLRSCPNQKQAVRWDERCILLYSDATIFGTVLTSPMWYWWNQQNATSPDKFEDDLRGLLERLRSLAASGYSLRKFAAGNVSGPDNQTIFALVQCTPDMSQQDCTSCLNEAYANIPNGCDGKRGCRVLTPSCSLRFETFPFYNETRLRELGAVSLSPPAPVPVPAVNPPSSPSLVDEISTAESMQYAFSTIKSGTNDFSDDSKLGQGGFGSVYKGKLPNGQEIAVKRLSMNSGQGDLEFKNEVLLLAKLQHRNLVRLLGFAIEGMEKLLIYEFVQNASLDQFIFDERSQSYLDWDRRYKIIGGIARGILYLHEDSRLRIIHRDIKASNILLDREMNPKIADFGMARLFRQDETQGTTIRIVGTYGYMPPEYIIHGQFSIKSDVFSFGVLVLEIVSGRKNNNFQIVLQAWKKWRQGRAADVVDSPLRSGSGSMSEMLRCIHIGLLCVQENAAERPTMALVVNMLNNSSISLGLPSQPAFYFSTTSDISQLDDYNSRDPHMPADQSYHSSHNDVSITELHPR